jgi:hypothetical protein
VLTASLSLSMYMGWRYYDDLMEVDDALAHVLSLSDVGNGRFGRFSTSVTSNGSARDVLIVFDGMREAALMAAALLFGGTARVLRAVCQPQLRARCPTASYRGSAGSTSRRCYPSSSFVGRHYTLDTES